MQFVQPQFQQSQMAAQGQQVYVLVPAQQYMMQQQQQQQLQQQTFSTQAPQPVMFQHMPLAQCGGSPQTTCMVPFNQSPHQRLQQPPQHVFSSLPVVPERRMSMPQISPNQTLSMPRISPQQNLIHSQQHISPQQTLSVPNLPQFIDTAFAPTKSAGEGSMSATFGLSSSAAAETRGSMTHLSGGSPSFPSFLNPSGTTISPFGSSSGSTTLLKPSMDLSNDVLSGAFLDAVDHNDTMKDKEDVGGDDKPFLKETCRHWQLGRCNRRKCRFQHQ